MAIGAVDEFSWKQVAVAAISAGVTQGISEGIGLDAGSIPADMARGAIRYSSSYAASKLVGQQTSFSWAGLAASSVGQALGNQVGGAIASGLDVNFDTHLGAQFASEMTANVAKTHIGRKLGQDIGIDYGMMAFNAFGDAIGNTIAGNLRQADFDKRVAEQSAISEGLNQASRNIAENLDFEVKGIDQQQLSQAANTTLLQNQISQLSKGVSSEISDAVTNQTSAEIANISKQTGNAISAQAAEKISTFVKTQSINDLGGIDINKANERSRYYQNKADGLQSGFDSYDQNAAFDAGRIRGELMYADGLRNRPDLGLDFSGLPKVKLPNITPKPEAGPAVGGLVYTYGGVISGDAIIGGSKAEGSYFAWDWDNHKISWGDYNNWQSGPSISLPSTEAGFSQGVYFTGDPAAALKGAFDADGMSGAFGLQGTLEVVTSLAPDKYTPTIYGLEYTVGVSSTPVDLAVHFHSGKSTFTPTPDGDFSYQPVVDLVNDAYESVEKSFNWWSNFLGN